MSKLLVIGSINVDLTFESRFIPNEGETIFGESFSLSLGGKGLNQYINALNCSKNTTFISAIGDDFLGEYVINYLNEKKIDSSFIKQYSGLETGVAQITLNNNNNRIIVIKGTNDKIDDKLLELNYALLDSSSYVLIQNEVNLSAIKYICDNKKKFNYKIIYNPAPYIFLDKYYIEKIDYMTPNETEYDMLIKDHGGAFNEKIIITRGEKGIEYNGKLYPAPIVKVVDTTGAGDTFNGIFSSLLANDHSLEDAIRIAVKCASYTVTKTGAHTTFNITEFM